MDVVDNKAKILAVAFKLFFHKGYKEVTMSELVKESGLSKGAFYHYFNSKEDLYHNSMELFLEGYMNQPLLDFDGEKSVRENLKIFFNKFSPVQEQMSTSTEESAEAMSKYLIFIQGLMKKAEFRNKLNKFNRDFQNDLAGWIIVGQSRNELRKEIDAHILSNHLMSLMKGIGVMHAFVDGEESIQLKFGRIIDQFFDLLEQKD